MVHEHGQERQDLSPGTLISRYRIIEKIGAGGMGVVYRAEDTRLKRHVALKLLPPSLTQDTEARERFLQEAQAASALDHPHICNVHEIDESEDGRLFIVMSFYDGQTLKRIIQQGPMRLDEALDIAIQIAEGLAAAHGRQIIHRDIKPANIMITADGTVKIMDFGLAKLAGQTGITRMGTTQGTVAYMSPEQTQGRQVDDGADVWSLGVVLYEMLTGRLPFRGEYEQAMIYSILNEVVEPASGLNTDVPAPLEEIVQRALEKNREGRYASVREMLADLRRVRDGAGTAGSRPGESPGKESTPSLTKDASKPRASITRWVYVAITLIAVTFVVILIRSRGPSLVQPPSHQQVTFAGDVSHPAISPGGDLIAYASSGSEGGSSVFVRELAGGTALEVFNDAEINCIRWSPDGAELLVLAVNDSVKGTYLVPRLGGTPRQFEIWSEVSWSPDGSRFAGIRLARKYIGLTDKVGGGSSSIPLSDDFTWTRGVDWSPLGDMLLVLEHEREQSRISTIRVDGSNQLTVVLDSVLISSARWSPGGDVIYYLRTGSQTTDLMKIAVSSATGKARSPAVPVQTGLQAGESFTLSGDNTRVLYTRAQSYWNLWLVRYGEDGQKEPIETRQLTTGTSLVYYASISPDGRTVAFSMGNLDQMNVFTMPIEGGPMKQLTFFDSRADGAAWSPDGKDIAFGHVHKGALRVWTVSSTGGTPKVFSETDLSQSHTITWAPGKDILYHRPGNRNFNVLNADTEAERPLVADESVGWMFWPRYSPDGRKVAVFWNRQEGDDPQRGLWVISLDDSSLTFVHPGGSAPTEWSSDGTWIYVWDREEEGPTIMRVPASGGEIEPFITLPLENMIPASMTLDGKSLVCVVYEEQSDVWLMENFDPEWK
ncbi:MAG: protein kinase [Candidatus Eisenbacteria bacterium]